jgi:hypothetical protein
MNDTDERPLDPECPNAPSGACPIVVHYHGGGRQISWCGHCNAYSNRRFEESQARRRIRATLPPPTTRLEVIERAAAAHAEYPQYDGHWRGPEWKIVRMRRQQEGKMGVSFEAGDITLAREQIGGEFDGSWFGYSWRTECDTLVASALDVEIIEG